MKCTNLSCNNDILVPTFCCMGIFMKELDEGYLSINKNTLLPHLNSTCGDHLYSEIYNPIEGVKYASM